MPRGECELRHAPRMCYCSSHVCVRRVSASKSTSPTRGVFLLRANQHAHFVQEKTMCSDEGKCIHISVARARCRCGSCKARRAEPRVALTSTRTIWHVGAHHTKCFACCANRIGSARHKPPFPLIDSRGRVWTAVSVHVGRAHSPPRNFNASRFH
jgi:hypothetical protein